MYFSLISQFILVPILSHNFGHFLFSPLLVIKNIIIKEVVSKTSQQSISMVYTISFLVLGDVWYLVKEGWIYNNFAIYKSI